MAVKHKIVENVEPQPRVDLTQILRVLQNINADRRYHNYNLPKICETIVYSLGNVNIPTKPNEYYQFMRDIKTIETILVQACTSNEVVFETLQAFYNAISDHSKHYEPTMAIILELIHVDAIPAAVKWILQSGHSKENLEIALLTLCHWLSRWTCTPNLGPLVLYFIKGLENEYHYDILITVTLKYIEGLFKLLLIPEIRKSVGPVVLHMLSSMQSNSEAFEKVIPHAAKMLQSLHKENSESSIFYLDELTNLFIMLMSHFSTLTNSYGDLILALKPFNSFLRYEYKLNYKAWIDKRNISDETYSAFKKLGLNNLGNTCYMNSVLQALFMTKLFRNDVLLMDKKISSLFSNLQNLFALLQFSNRQNLSPMEFYKLARPTAFLHGHQHDSSEFLCHLLDTLHEKEKCTLGNSSIEAASYTTVIQRSFGGQTATTSKCGTCASQSESADYFNELQLSFPSNCVNPSIQNLVDYYLQPESLCGENQYHCNHCHGLTDGERITRIVKMPARLVLTLKNFSYDQASQERTKLLQHIQLDSYLHIENVNYKLYAAVVHNGTSLDSGHYYTYAHDGEKWFKFNDCLVLQVAPDELYNVKPPETPYMLFYCEQDCTEPESLPRTALPPFLETLVMKDHVDFNLEQRTKQNSNFNNNKRNDDPPPPGCGGDSFINNQSGRYVF